MFCKDHPDVRVRDAEALELALRSVLDEDEACDAARLVMGQGWRPGGAQLHAIAAAARDVDRHLSADGPPFRFDGLKLDRGNVSGFDTETDLLILHDTLNDLEAFQLGGHV
ncbi:MAG TPA: hypothetical protein VG265_05845 [Gaiellaceae bacterium]|jgi:hypothetical protein|nr:hypothetical protein [Gaiellaceae bacterium]